MPRQPVESISPSDVLRAGLSSMKKRAFSERQTKAQKARLVILVAAVFSSVLFLTDFSVALAVSAAVFATVRWIHLKVLDIKGNLYFGFTVVYSVLLTAMSKGYAFLYRLFLGKIKRVQFFPEFPYKEQTLTKSLTGSEIKSRDTRLGPKIPKIFPSPNQLTVFRAMGAVFMAMNYRMSIAVALPIFVLLTVTDALDGIIARTQDRITAFGIWADPIADRMLLVAISIHVYYIDPFFWKTAAVRILVPEMVVMIVGSIIFVSKRSVMPAPVFWGRVKCLFYFLSVSSLLAGGTSLAVYFLNTGFFFACITSCSYLTRFYTEHYCKSIYSGLLEWLVTHSWRHREELPAKP